MPVGNPRLIVPAVLTYLHPAAAFVESLATAMGFVKEARMHISLALEEAFTNVVKHGFEGDGLQTFEIVCRPDSMGLIVAIREKGLPFDPDKMPVYSLEEVRQDRAVAGLGTHLMKHMVDEVSYNNRGREGWEIVFTKHLQRNRIENLLGEEERPSPETPSSAVDVENVSPTLRDIARDDAIEVSRSAYLAYGYGYEEYIYYPERVLEMNAQGLLKSVVAVDEKNRFMAHMALKFKKPGDSVAESGVAFVKPEYRRLGLMGGMDRWLREKAREMGLKGVFGRAVTSHVASQKMSARQGYVECGIMLGNFPADVEFKNMASRTPYRESGMLSYQCLGSPGPATIHPPRRHAGIIASLLERLGVPLKAADGEPPSSTPDGVTRYSEEILQMLNVVEIRVYEYGPHVAEDITARVETHCMGR